MSVCCCDTAALCQTIASPLLVGIDQSPSEVAQKVVHHGCQ